MDTTVPQIHAETGFESDESPPLRVTGFICLVCGILSIFSPIGRGMLIFPVLAFVFGLIALRRSDGPPPVGRRPAMLGMLLAAGFGMCGVMLPFLKSETLGSQAERFSRYYLEVIALGQDEFALELNKDYVNRFPETMSLKEHYYANDQSLQRFTEFRDSSVNEMIRQRGPGAPWVLDRPVRVYYSYRREHAEVVWMDPTGEVESKILMILEYRVDSKGQGQWNVANAMPLTQRYVADSIL